MNNLISISALIATLGLATLGLSACDKAAVANGTDEKMITPDSKLHNEKSIPGQSGDEGIQREKGKSKDEGIQGDPVNPDTNPPIIIPPPVVNMPADIVPEKPAN